MSGQGPSLPPLGAPVARGGQGDVGAELNLGGRDASRGGGAGADPRQGERFGKALQKAMAVQKPVPDDAVQGGVPMQPPMPFAVAAPNGEPAVAVPQAVQTVAERIEAYLRRVEGAGQLRAGEAMSVKLPANVLGVAQVTVQRVGDVLQVTLAMQSGAAALAGAQVAQLGQALSQRLGRQAVELREEREERDAAVTGKSRFDPLTPGGRA